MVPPARASSSRSDDASVGGRRSDEREVVVTWVGHATVLLELEGVRLLTDPVLRDRIGPLVRLAPAGGAEPVGRVDCVLLSHLHGDHADLPSLRAVSGSRAVAGSVPVLAPLGAGPWLTRHGIADVRELHPGSEVELGGVRVSATPAAHE